MRLTDAQLADHLDTSSAEARELVETLRAIVLDAAPGTAESIHFNSLCYAIPDSPFGAIGGNVCMISVRDGKVSLGFIHGEGLPDPSGLLTGTGKAKREVLIGSVGEARGPALRALIRASHADAGRRVSGERGGVEGGV